MMAGLSMGSGPERGWADELRLLLAGSECFDKLSTNGKMLNEFKLCTVRPEVF